MNYRTHGRIVVIFDFLRFQPIQMLVKCGKNHAAFFYKTAGLIDTNRHTGGLLSYFKKFNFKNECFIWADNTACSHGPIG